MENIEYIEIFNDGENKLLIAFDVEVSDYYYYHIFFENIAFKGKSIGTYYSKSILDFIDSFNNNKDIVEIFDMESDDYLSFKKIDNLGHFELKGLMGGTFRDCYLNFKFKVDQTALVKLAEYFKKNCK